MFNYRICLLSNRRWCFKNVIQIYFLHHLCKKVPEELFHTNRATGVIYLRIRRKVEFSYKAQADACAMNFLFIEGKEPWTIWGCTATTAKQRQPARYYKGVC
jgi:hypothetical protein